MGELKDEILGKCKFTSFFIENKLYGGYACECERGNIYVDFVPSEKVIELAKKENMSIALAGGKWKEIGRMGFGELVKPEDAVILVSKLKRKFGD